MDLTPDRIDDVLHQFEVSQFIFFYIAIRAMKGGAKATDKVWEGADGLEWTLSSPPPYHSFAVAPKIK